MQYAQEKIKLPLSHSGKVRDIFEVPDMPNTLLFVVSDRISAYDVIMREIVPGKGTVLNKLSYFWFNKLSHIIPNHLITTNVSAYPKSCKPYAEYLEGRSMLVRKLDVLPVECIVRGRLTGSYWSTYTKASHKKTESDFASFVEIFGQYFQTNLEENATISPPLFTPSTKAEAGLHDENISFEQMKELIGTELAIQIRNVSIELFQEASSYALQRGIIIADSKLEFALDKNNNLYLVDEVFTPDSSRFWPADKIKLGVTPPSYDKQYLRDWLKTLDWDKSYPPPTVPIEVIEGTRKRYFEALITLTK